MEFTIRQPEAWAGVYPFDLGQLTHEECEIVRRFSGVRFGELFDELFAGHTAVICVLAALACARAGKTTVDQAADLAAEFSKQKVMDVFPKIDDDADAGEGDAGPPELTGSSESSEPTGSSGSSSGTTGTLSGVNPATTPAPTGGPISDTSITSPPETSAT